MVRAKLRKLFEGAGYAVVMARDGLEALAVLEQQHFALMITDLEMPNLDGVGLIARLNAEAEARGDSLRMPMLAITGHDDLQSQLAQCRGLHGIFRKPWQDEELLYQVQALAGHRQAPAVANA